MQYHGEMVLSSDGTMTLKREILLSGRTSGIESDKGSDFREDRDLLYPIPLYEITMSNNSIKQNPGWN